MYVPKTFNAYNYSGSKCIIIDKKRVDNPKFKRNLIYSIYTGNFIQKLNHIPIIGIDK